MNFTKSYKLNYFINRKTGKTEVEKTYGEDFLRFLYGKCRLGWPIVPLISKVSFLSKLYGFLQSLTWSRRKIAPFIKTYDVDETEFLEPVEKFRSFNDFFIRKLKKECRPLDSADAIIPADGRYNFSQNGAETIFVKGKNLDLEELFGNSALAKRYEGGAFVLGRLCPSDYHRFHFPFDCTPSQPKLINGPLYSVNPIALRRNIGILTENKRMITELASPKFGLVQYIEVGATFVGSIHETFTPGQFYRKGEEKGYFSFGGSALILLFEKGAITLFPDLLNHPYELRCLLGESLGTSV